MMHANYIWLATSQNSDESILIFVVVDLFVFREKTMKMFLGQQVLVFTRKCQDCRCKKKYPTNDFVMEFIITVNGDD